MKLAGISLVVGLLLVAPVAQAVTTHIIQVGNNFFNPSSPTIQAGDIVKWVWVSGIHTTTSGIRGSMSAGSLWDRPIDAGHTSYSHTFTTEGSFPYFCANHASMAGTITVMQPTGVTDDPPASLPTATAVLNQNQPNPFNSATAIPYTLSEPTRVSLAIANILGQRVKMLVESEQAPGSYIANWDGRDESGREVPTGIYFYRFSAGSVSQTRKMVVLR